MSSCPHKLGRSALQRSGKPSTDIEPASAGGTLASAEAGSGSLTPSVDANLKVRSTHARLKVPAPPVLHHQNRHRLAPGEALPVRRYHDVAVGARRRHQVSGALPAQ